MGGGRPPGSRNRRTMFFEEFQKNGIVAIQKTKHEALQGNIQALNSWLDRLVPRCKPQNSRFRLPPMRTTEDLVKVLPAALEAIARGQLSAQDGEAIARIVQSQQRVIESAEFDQRLRALEQKATSTSGSTNEAPDAGDPNCSREENLKPVIENEPVRTDPMGKATH
jgi:hypothetical protein